MNEIQPTFAIAVQIWWAWTWRAVLVVLGVSILAGFVIGFIGAIIGAPKDGITAFSGLLGGVIGLYFSIKILKKILNKKFKTYRIALIRD